MHLNILIKNQIKVFLGGSGSFAISVAKRV
jgi:hypothetical protein